MKGRSVLRPGSRHIVQQLQVHPTRKRLIVGIDLDKTRTTHRTILLRDLLPSRISPANDPAYRIAFQVQRQGLRC